MQFFLLILTVFLVRVHFFYSFLKNRKKESDFKRVVKKSVPLRGKCTLLRGKQSKLEKKVH